MRRYIKLGMIANMLEDRNRIQNYLEVKDRSEKEGCNSTGKEQVITLR